jgi:hypothetical protein
MNRRNSQFFATLLLTLVFPLAAQSESPPVTLSVSSCHDLSQAEIERILNIELRTIARGRKEVESAPTHVSVRCANQSVTIEARVPKKAAVHTDSLHREASESREGTERLIAIAAAELIFSAWVDLLPPQREPIPEAPRQEKERANQSSRPAVQKKDNRKRIVLTLGLGPHWRMYLAEKAHLFGGELALTLSLSRLFYLRIGGSAEAGRGKRRIGEVVMIAGSGLVSLGLEKAFVHFAIGLEAGARFGSGVLRGASDKDDVQTETVKGGVGGPLIRLRFRTVNAVSMRLALEMEYAVYGNTGRVFDDYPIHMKGIYLSVALAVGFDL